MAGELDGDLDDEDRTEFGYSLIEKEGAQQALKQDRWPKSHAACRREVLALSVSDDRRNRVKARDPPYRSGTVKVWL